MADEEEASVLHGVTAEGIVVEGAEDVEDPVAVETRAKKKNGNQ